MPRYLIAVQDNVAQDLIGPIQLFAHDAPAVRMFQDAIRDERTQLHQHPEDYTLVSLGELTDDLTVITAKRVIITGAAMIAPQHSNTTEPTN